MSEAVGPPVDAFRRMLEFWGINSFSEDDPITASHLRMAGCAAAKVASNGKWSDPTTPYGKIGQQRLDDLVALLLKAGANREMAEASAAYIARQVIFRVTGPEIPKQKDATINRELTNFAKAVKKLDLLLENMGGATRHHLSVGLYQAQLLTESDNSLRAKVITSRSASDTITHELDRFKKDVALFECVAEVCAENFRSSDGPTVDHNERNALRNAIDQWADATGVWPVDSKRTEPPKLRMQSGRRSQAEIEASADVKDTGLNAPLLDEMRSMAFALAPESPRARFSDYAYLVMLGTQKSLRIDENIPSPSDITPPRGVSSEPLSSEGS